MRLCFACSTIFAACVFAQQVTVAPSFDAASVKPSGPDSKGSGVRFLPGGRFSARNSPLIDFLVRAYDVTEFQVADAPGWVRNAGIARFDMEATAPTGDVDTARLKLMLQTLLANRFQLRVHHETRSVPVYALVPARTGLRIRAVADIDKARGKPAFDFNPSGGHVDGTNARMPDVVTVLQRWLDRPLIDKTSFADAFSLTLSWAPGPENNHGLPFGVNADDPRPSLFTALQDQLGLRLNAERDPLDVIVVDHVEMPSPN